MDDLQNVVEIAKQAGEILAKHFYSNASLNIQLKSDDSPVTKADIAASHFIVDALQKLDGNIPVLSEENTAPSFDIRKTWTRYWLIDPLDGTRGFIEKLPEFCVNIALIDHHRPVLGVIYSPIEKIVYFAKQGEGAWRQASDESRASRIHTRKTNLSSLHLICGHSKRNAEILKAYAVIADNITLTTLHSALKFGRIAAGEADLYVRLGPTSEWDTAAGQCIIEAAGGALVDMKGDALRYNTQDSLINPPFLAVADVRHLMAYLESKKM